MDKRLVDTKQWSRSSRSMLIAVLLAATFVHCNSERDLEGYWGELDTEDSYAGLIRFEDGFMYAIGGVCPYSGTIENHTLSCPDEPEHVYRLQKIEDDGIYWYEGRRADGIGEPLAIPMRRLTLWERFVFWRRGELP